MAGKSKIEWTDATWPVVQGCDPVSQGCVHCYAVKELWRMMHHPDPKISGPLQGVVEKYINAAGEEIFRFTGKLALREDRLDWPLRWSKPRMIFVPSHGDIFHKDVPESFLDRIFQTIEQAYWHTYQILTKRSERMRDYMVKRFAKKQRYADAFKNCPTPEMRDSPAARDARALAAPAFWKNIWLGVSAEDQASWDERKEHLRDTPAAVRFASFEPLLGPIVDNNLAHTIQWAIAGGESGTRARPMHPAWVRSLRDQCAAADVTFFFKQWGEWVSVSEVEDAGEHFHFADHATVRRVGKARAGRTLDGVTHDAMPGRA